MYPKSLAPHTSASRSVVALSVPLSPIRVTLTGVTLGYLVLRVPSLGYLGRTGTITGVIGYYGSSILAQAVGMPTHRRAHCLGRQLLRTRVLGTVLSGFRRYASIRASRATHLLSATAVHLRAASERLVPVGNRSRQNQRSTPSTVCVPQQ